MWTFSQDARIEGGKVFVITTADEILVIRTTEVRQIKAILSLRTIGEKWDGILRPIAQRKRG